MVVLFSRCKPLFCPFSLRIGGLTVQPIKMMGYGFIGRPKPLSKASYFHCLVLNTTLYDTIIIYFYLLKCEAISTFKAL
jgi:hypothetical protein